MQKRFWIYIVVLLLASPACKKKPDGGGTNPTLPANAFLNPLLSSGPDPWIAKQGNTYYYTHTLGDKIALWKTSKVTELRYATPQTIWTAPSTGANARDVWAPEIHYINNKWYAYYAADDDGPGDNHRMFVLENSSADPLTGTWVSKGKINDPTDKWAIDGTVFEHNGQLYFLWSGWEGNTNVRQDIYIAKMSNPWTIEGNRVKLSSPTLNWEMVGDPDVNEGPQYLKGPTERVFIVYSASGCWTDDYALGMLTLKAGGDPMNVADWTKTPSPVFTKNPSGSAYGPGHNSFFKSADGTEDWILYHANPQSGNGQGCGNSRSPRAQKFTWNADGTPNFGAPVSINTPITKPSGE